MLLVEPPDLPELAVVSAMDEHNQNLETEKKKKKKNCKKQLQIRSQ